MTKMSRAVFAFGGVLAAAVALAGTAGAQAGQPGVACPAVNFPPNFTDNIIIPSNITGVTVGADCWTGNTWATGLTRARGWVTKLSNAYGLRAYLFAARSPDPHGISHRSARVAGFSSQGLSSSCFLADAGADTQSVPPSGQAPRSFSTVGGGPCANVQEFRVVAMY